MIPTKTCFVLAVAALVAAAMPFLAQAQQAQPHHHCNGCGIGAGVAAGVAAGAAAEALKSNAQDTSGASYKAQSDTSTSGFTRNVCRVEEIGNRRVETCGE